MNISYVKELNKEYDKQLKKFEDIQAAQKKLNDPLRRLPYTQLPGSNAIFSPEDLREMSAKAQIKLLDITQKIVEAEGQITKEQQERLNYFTKVNIESGKLAETMARIQNAEGLKVDEKNAFAHRLALAGYDEATQRKVLAEVARLEEARREKAEEEAEKEEEEAKKRHAQIIKERQQLEDRLRKLREQNHLNTLDGYEKEIQA